MKTMVTETKLPTDARAVIRDPDLAAALEELMQPLEGEALRAAQAAIRDVRSSGFTGSYGDLLDTYRAAITAAVDQVG